MLIFILLIFINNNLISAEDDESAENRYIEMLPEKEKREFLETVARRILEDVKSKEAQPGLVSGEITDDQLKAHSEYVTRLLKEETENLKRRNQEKNDTVIILKTNTNSTKANVDLRKFNKFVEKPIKVVSNSTSILRDNEPGLEKDKKIKENKDVYIDLTLREGNNGENKTEKVEILPKSTVSDKMQQIIKEKATTNDYNKSMELTLPINSTTQDQGNVQNDKQGTDSNTHIDMTLKQRQTNDPNSNNENTTEKDNTNKQPISIEITFVNEDDEKGSSENSHIEKKDEVPVKVVYEKKEGEKEVSSTTNIAMIINTDKNEETNKKEQQKMYRKSLSEGIDGNVQNIDQISDNQIARKKRKSKSSDTDSETESTTKFGDVNETESNQNIEKAVTGSVEITTEQPNNNLNLNTDLTSEFNHNKTLESTTKSTPSYEDSTSNIVAFENNTETPLVENVQTSSLEKENKRSHDENLENTTAENDIQNTVSKGFGTNETETVNDSTNGSNYTNANITEIPFVEKFDMSTLKKEVELSHDENLESSTTNDNVQHTVINDFDANENETFPDSSVTANYTGTTTEEIVKMRTKHISGYPEDSNESSTPGEMSVDIKNTTKSIENATSSYISPAESNLNASFYALKLSDKDVNVSFTKEKEDSNRSEINEPDNFRADFKDSITSTTIPPLTTARIEQEKEIVAMEGPVEIKFDDVILLKAKNINTLPLSAKLNNTDEVSDKLLRQGLLKQNNKNEISKIKPSQKEYFVYEILPGQELFVKKETPDMKSKKRNPKSYPKLTKYKPNASKSLYIENEQTAQTEQPKYAPVYNYAPEYAYYNPRNKYGLNADDKNVKIVDERSNESENAEIEKIFDYDIENDKKQPEIKQGSDQKLFQYYRMPDKETRETKEHDGIDEDYYFGFFNRNTKQNALLRTRIKDPEKWMKKIMCKGKYCHEPIATVIQDAQVPPNSDEPQHAHNAMLNKNPPVTHIRQVQSILGDLGYFHHNHNHVHTMKCTHKNPDKAEYYHGSGESWIGTNVDLLYAKKHINKKHLLRSGGEHNVWDTKTLQNKLREIKNVPSLQERIKKHLNEVKESANNKRVSLKIPNHLQEKNRLHLKALNETFNSVRKSPMVLLTGSPIRLSKHAFKKRPLFLLTGRHKGMSKHMDHKTPLILLTGKPNGNIKDKDEKNTLVLLTGRLDNQVKHGKRVQKINKKSIEKLLEAQYYDDIDKRIMREESSSFENYKDPDAGDSASTEEAKSLKTLNFDVVNQIINMSQDSKDPRLQQKLIQKFKKTRNFYLPAENPIKKDYNVIEKELWALASRSKSDKSGLEPYVEVMTNMIASDNIALKKYDWLATTAGIRSAFTKLINLCDSLQTTNKDIHPKDLQLVKYILYLYSSNQNLFDQENQKSPLNLRLSNDAKEPVKNTKRYKGYNGRRRRHRISRKYLQKPWLNKKGLKGMAADLRDFFEDLGRVLDDFHDAIKHIALVTNYQNQRWFENLKEVYLSSPPSRKQVLEIILHLETARVIGLIEESAANGLETNYVKYGLANPEQVNTAKEEFGFVVKFYLELKKLQ